jgi:hypothetical protein
LVIDSDQPEMQIGTPTGHYHIPLGFMFSGRADLDANAETAEVLLFADTTSRGDRPIAASSTVKTPMNLLGGGESSVSYATSAVTTDITDPVCSHILAFRTLLLEAATRFARPATPAPAPALALATRLATIAEAVEVGAAIAFDSQPQARAWQARMDAAIAAAAADAAVLATTLPLGAGPAWRATSALRRSFAVDMSARIGRLPEVLELTVPAPAAAWVLAQHIAGDAPGSVQATLIDILRRNGIRAPGMVAPGRLEILRPTLAAWRIVDGPRVPEEVQTAGAGLFVLDVSRLDVDRIS